MPVVTQKNTIFKYSFIPMLIINVKHLLATVY